MFDELNWILEQVAIRHNTTTEAVREEISIALKESHADPELNPEDFIAFAALTASLSVPAPALN